MRAGILYGVAKGVAVLLSRRDFTVGLEEASRERAERVGNAPSHGLLERGARSEAGRMAIGTICPTWQTGHSCRDWPVNFS